ncbi:histidine phosphatase family protein [archaeon]|nr:MAG: histidine phosphatase family protein [archaeon]
MIPSAWKRTDIFLVRHGESANNCLYSLIRAKFGDSLSSEEFEAELEKIRDPDSGLSPRGHAQAAKLREYLTNSCFPSNTVSSAPGDSSAKKVKVYSSPMRRCLLTAQEVARGLGDLPVTVHPRFHESDGCFKKGGCADTTIGLPGLTKSQVEEMFPGFVCLPGMDDGWYKGSAKETGEEFLVRAQEIVDFLWNLHDTASDDPGSVVLVIHGNVIREVMSRLMKTTAVMLTHCNTGYSHVQLWTSSTQEPYRFVSVQYVNRIDHLTDRPALIAGNDVFADHWVQEYIHHLPK